MSWNLTPMRTAAEAFAIEAHGKQRYGTHPYAYHLRAVVEVLQRFGFGSVGLVNAGWLHDTLEDTATRYHDLWDRFGKETADLVEAVTDKPGKNRRERHAATYPALRAAGRRAVTLKLADRIANVEHSVDTKNWDKLKMYKKEHADFARYLYDEGDGLDEMWDHLGGLLGFERPDQQQYRGDA